MTRPKPDNAVELSPPEMEPEAWVDPSDLEYSFSRSGGPGGQAVNKLSTRAQLRVAVEAVVGLTDEMRDRLRTLAGQRLTRGDELIFEAETSRSQLDNKKACLTRLRALVADAMNVPKPRKPIKPTRGMVQRRLAEKRRQAQKKDSRRKPEEE